MLRGPPGVLFALLLAACSTGPVALEVQQLAGWGEYAPQPYIQLLGAPPNGPYVPIARLVAIGAAGLDRAQVLTVLQDHARALGANAIVVTDATQRSAPSLTYNPSGGLYAVSPPEAVPKFIGLAVHVGEPKTTQ
jgi:hypothetical protein